MPRSSARTKLPAALCSTPQEPRTRPCDTPIPVQITPPIDWPIRACEIIVGPSMLSSITCLTVESGNGVDLKAGTYRARARDGEIGDRESIGDRDCTKASDDQVAGPIVVGDIMFHASSSFGKPQVFSAISANEKWIDDVVRLRNIGISRWPVMTSREVMSRKKLSHLVYRNVRIVSRQG